jgi:hypothetical protein
MHRGSTALGTHGGAVEVVGYARDGLVSAGHERAMLRWNTAALRVVSGDGEHGRVFHMWRGS